MELLLLRDVTAWISDDPTAQLVLGVLISGLSIAAVVAVVFVGLRPVFHLIRDRWGVEDAWYRLGLRLGRWVVALLVALVPGHAAHELPWVALVALALVSAEWSESIWSWAKVLARLTGRRVTSIVSGKTR